MHGGKDQYLNLFSNAYILERYMIVHNSKGPDWTLQ